MTYEQALEYLASLNKFGINFGLARIEKLLDLMGNPERRFKTVHVTGSNGKGSTAAMLAAILRAAGIKTALYTSPHLADYIERMAIDGRLIDRQAFANAIEYTGNLVARITASGWEHPTEFEVLTAAAFHYFAAAEVEYAVIEVGLGGLLDSTNVVIPEAAVITNVTLEHTDRCGNSVEEIAGHKAGIIKPGVPAITAAHGAALDVIKATAAAKSAPLYIKDRDFSAQAVGREGYRQTMTVVTERYGDMGCFTTNLLGHHQVENSAVAVMTALILAEKEPRVTLSAIRAGMAAVHWPGRFEVVETWPTVVIDGAHNPDGAKALRKTLDDIFGGKNIVFLLGILADKDIGGIVRELVRQSNAAVLVRPNSERAAKPEMLHKELTARKIEIAASIEEGYEKACLLAGPEGVVCITGSLYLIGPARTAVFEGGRKKPARCTGA